MTFAGNRATIVRIAEKNLRLLFPRQPIQVMVTSSTGSFLSAQHTEASSRLTAAGGSMAANWPLTPLSADSQSCNTRLDEAFTAGTWDPSGGEGADIDAILNAIGQIRGITVSNLTRTSADIAITPYSASAVGDLNYKAGPVSSFSSATGVTQISSSSGSPRTFNLTGLAENTVFDVMIQCDRGDRVYVSFETE